MDKFRNKYRIESARAPWWDYGWNGSYFITICTQDHKHYFGRVADGEMHLSEIGNIVHHCWLEIPDHFSFVGLGEFVAMPNHVHGIIIIDKPNDGRNVETQNFASLQSESPKLPGRIDKSKNQFGPQSKNLGSIIRGFKIGVTKSARLVQKDFAWQPRFHDHIIRNGGEYQRISNYIINNPFKWAEDRFYGE